jgi:hypothetical protein
VSQTFYSPENPATLAVLDVIRRIASDEAATSSLRHLAPDIGIGHSTLHNFLCGAIPHPRVRRLLYDWYARHRGVATARALDALMNVLPDEVRAAVKDNVVRELAAGYRRASLPVPQGLLSADNDPVEAPRRQEGE